MEGGMSKNKRLVFTKLGNDVAGSEQAQDIGRQAGLVLYYYWAFFFQLSGVAACWKKCQTFWPIVLQSSWKFVRSQSSEKLPRQAPIYVSVDMPNCFKPVLATTDGV